ncbi:MAG: 4a-hydroxytetrahydrobiopterin dehydratase, partial [Thermoguttaceae bacterium]|nr:4a-hydroxytetrahydrobiopterin dehydratase [Thermoguttaceae bacterium]
LAAMPTIVRADHHRAIPLTRGLAGCANVVPNRIGDVPFLPPHLRFELTTHVAGGLTENDFILAAQIEELLYASAAGPPPG